MLYINPFIPLIDLLTKMEVMEEAMKCLGKGFDLTSDFRLRFTKGGGRLVVVDESNTRDVVVPPSVTFKDVPHDIRVDKGDRIRFKSDVLQFNQVKLCFGFFDTDFAFE